jgi:ABC-type bacteriocin/lantibiotic exporter with double-glycine peptidase domain
MRMALEHFGIKKSEKQLIRQLKTNNKTGTKRSSIIKIVEKLKLKYHTGGRAKLSDLKRYKKEGFVIIVEFYLFSENAGHYVIVDKVTGNYVYLIDPYFGPKRRIGINSFRKAWTRCGNYDKEPRWFIALKKK